MRVREFYDSLKEGESTVVGFDDFKIIVDDKLTDQKFAIDRGVYDVRRGELQLVVNTELAAEVHGLADDALHIYGPATHLLERYLRQETGSFVTHVFAAIQVADPVNRRRLKIAFPAEVEAFERWQADPAGSDFGHQVTDCSCVECTAMKCPAEFETATGVYEAAVNDGDDCAGCGAPKAAHGVQAVEERVDNDLEDQLKGLATMRKAAKEHGIEA